MSLGGEQALPAGRHTRHIREDWQEGVFRIHRDAFRSRELFEREREVLWNKGWLYLGHTTELPHPGDYKVRKLGGRPLIFLRDAKGAIRAFYNSCPHRGTAVCREEEGNARHLRCFYHAWTFDTEGRLVSLPSPEAYPGSDTFRERLGLRPVAQLETLRDFVFVSFDEHAPPLGEYLGPAADFVHLVADQSAAGMRVLPGTQRYTARANWKLLVENAMDGYHFAPSHITFLEYLKRTGYTTSDAVSSVQICGRHLGSVQPGHGGRIGLSWEPRFGEAERERTEANRTEIFRRLGEERGRFLADGFHVLYMMPNLLLFDIESVSVRVLEPVAPDLTEVSAWALAPADESPEASALRLKTLVSFIGPGGLATPDDLEAQEAIQRGIAATAGDEREGVDWNDVSRGMAEEAAGAPLRTIDEAGLRHFWRTWDEAVSGSDPLGRPRLAAIG
ncbi:MAG TPA: aromatic ring-hydroxylating dioxygenase subunit alpha [Acidimicrobiales bacterium]|nr:aromatic ring-hydroxylating dioxygenase subunit alpha [Acidimicrobiales bacterium]